VGALHYEAIPERLLDPIPQRCCLYLAYMVKCMLGKQHLSELLNPQNNILEQKTMSKMGFVYATNVSKK
jgi:hypothetical protein